MLSRSRKRPVSKVVVTVYHLSRLEVELHVDEDSSKFCLTLRGFGLPPFVATSTLQRWGRSFTLWLVIVFGMDQEIRRNLRDLSPTRRLSRAYYMI